MGSAGQFPSGLKVITTSPRIEGPGFDVRKPDPLMALTLGRLESLRLCDLQSAVARAAVHDKNLIWHQSRTDPRKDRLHPSISLSTRMNSVTRKLSDS